MLIVQTTRLTTMQAYIIKRMTVERTLWSWLSCCYIVEGLFADKFKVLAILVPSFTFCWFHYNKSKHMKSKFVEIVRFLLTFFLLKVVNFSYFYPFACSHQIWVIVNHHALSCFSSSFCQKSLNLLYFTVCFGFSWFKGFYHSEIFQTLLILS